MKKARNGEIDVFRFVFAVIIVLRHFSASFSRNIFEYGAISVEFFCLISGYLMAKKAESMNVPSREIGNETWRFIIKKTKSFYPYYICAIIFQVIVRYILIKHKSFDSLMMGFTRSVPTLTLTFLEMVGDLGLNIWYVPNTWFLSGLLISSLILYPIMLKCYENSVKIIFPIFSIFVIGYMNVQYNTIVPTWSNWTGFFNNGMIRMMTELAAGASLYALTSFVIKKHEEGMEERSAGSVTVKKCILTVVKIYCYLQVILYAQNGPKDFSLFAFFYCVIGVILSFSGEAYTITDCKVTRYLGRISLPIYMFHGVIRLSCSEVITASKISNPLFFGLAAMSIVVSVLLMHLTDFVMYLPKMIKKKRQTSIQS